MADKVLKRRVTLTGRTPLMFDRYLRVKGGESRPPAQLLYYSPTHQGQLVFPALNLHSFLSAENTESAPKRLLDPRKYRKVARAALAHVEIMPDLIPILRDGKPLVFKGFGPEGEPDPATGIYVRYDVARLPKGVPNEKARPVLPLPWELRFEVTLYPNPDLKEPLLVQLFQEGGRAVGLGTYRGIFGKFALTQWEPVE